MKNKILEVLKGIVIFFLAISIYSSFSESKYTTQTEQIQTINQYPTIYSHGENLKEIYTNPLLGIYVYLCENDSKHKSDVNLLNGIYIEKPTAKVNGNTVQNIFIFDKFPDIKKIENLTDYKNLVNTIIAEKPIMGFHRCYIKFYKNYYNQAFIYEKDKNQYIFYNGAGGNWQADSVSKKEFTVQDSSEYTGGMWDYKEKSEINTQQVKQTASQNNKPTLEASPELQAQYKAEIEKTINIETVKAKKEIDKTYQEADELYNHILATESYTTENYDKLESYSQVIDSPVFWLYVKLIDITKKYINLGETPATDFTPILAEFIEPILKKYNISNLNKLTKLSTYTSQKQEEIETRLSGIKKTIFSEN